MPTDNPCQTDEPLCLMGIYFMENQKEVWIDIPDFEGYYQVSNLGNVKSLDRLIYNKGCNSFCKHKGKMIKKTVNWSGYLCVCLYRNCKLKTIAVHKLVAMAFLNHIPCGHKLVINHKNFDKLDNRVENLEIVTNRQNTNKKHLESTSIYTGVCWHKRNKKWTASIYINGKLKHLGCFKNELDAYIAYEKHLKLIK